MGASALAVIFLVFFFFPLLTAFIAGVFSIPTGSY
jgi:hypothetical protein